jgi:osmotically-inducible protein OsmY
MIRSISRTLAIAAIALLASACAGTEQRASTGVYIDDAAITTKVTAALVASPLTAAREIQVETFKGVVQLSGFVDSADEKEEAERLAEDIDGVSSVQNRIAVK